MADTMQIEVVLGDTSLVALLDSGSTQNFISDEAVRCSGLPLRRWPRLTAMVANGEQITCEGVIRDAPLLIDGPVSDRPLRYDAGWVRRRPWHQVARRAGTHHLGPRSPAHVVPARAPHNMLARRAVVNCSADLGNCGRGRGRPPKRAAGRLRRHLR
jgi:hypothetical protein